jgi:hypothetical protein
MNHNQLQQELCNQKNIIRLNTKYSKSVTINDAIERPLDTLFKKGCKLY